MKELPSLGWTDEKIGILVKWCATNSEKLLFQKDDIEYIEKQFIIINKCHEEFEEAALAKTEISKHINFDADHEIHPRYDQKISPKLIL